jgi:chromosome segregation ATPase
VNNSGTFSVVISLVEGKNIIEARSSSLLFESSRGIIITYVNEIPGIENNITIIHTNINALDTLLNQSFTQGNLTRTGLSVTTAWLRNVSDELVKCYNAHNMTSGQVSTLIGQLSHAETTLTSFRDSLNTTSSNLTLTNSQVSELESNLNTTISEVSSAKAGLATVQSELGGTQNDVATLQNDSLPLIIGALGLILGILAIVLILVRTRGPKTKWKS